MTNLEAKIKMVEREDDHSDNRSDPVLSKYR